MAGERGGFDAEAVERQLTGQCPGHDAERMIGGEMVFCRLCRADALRTAYQRGCDEMKRERDEALLNLEKLRAELERWHGMDKLGISTPDDAERMAWALRKLREERDAANRRVAELETTLREVLACRSVGQPPGIVVPSSLANRITTLLSALSEPKPALCGKWLPGEEEAEQPMFRCNQPAGHPEGDCAMTMTATPGLPKPATIPGFTQTAPGVFAKPSGSTLLEKPVEPCVYCGTGTGHAVCKRHTPEPLPAHVKAAMVEVEQRLGESKPTEKPSGEPDEFDANGSGGNLDG